MCQQAENLLKRASKVPAYKLPWSWQILVDPVLFSALFFGVFPQ